VSALISGVEAAPEETSTPRPQEVVSDFVPKVTELTGVRDGDRVSFTWVNEDPQEGDMFIWNVVDVSGEVDPQPSELPEATFTAGQGTVCIDVILRRDDGRASEPARGCVD
jgi:hypothetical protein